MTQQRRMTVHDAARKMGISEDAVRMRISARPFRRRTSEKAKTAKFIYVTSANRPYSITYAVPALPPSHGTTIGAA